MILCFHLSRPPRSAQMTTMIVIVYKVIWVCEPLTKAYFSNFAPVSSFPAFLPADHWSPLLGPEVNIFVGVQMLHWKVDTSEMLIFMN